MKQVAENLESIRRECERMQGKQGDQVADGTSIECSPVGITMDASATDAEILESTLLCRGEMETYALSVAYYPLKSVK